MLKGLIPVAVGLSSDALIRFLWNEESLLLSMYNSLRRLLTTSFKVIFSSVFVCLVESLGHAHIEDASVAAASVGDVDVDVAASNVDVAVVVGVAVDVAVAVAVAVSDVVAFVVVDVVGACVFDAILV